MPLMPYTRKAGDGGACAVLVGGGDGSLMRDCCVCYERVVVISMPGEKEFTDRPANVHQYIIRGPQDANEVVSHGFAHQRHVVDLECTDFYTAHPCACDPQVRADFCTSFFNLLTARPFTFGDDAIDGLQGAYHIALSAHLLAPAPTPAELPKLSCPVVCVAPGPSLAKHLDALRELQHKCLLISADTALEGLLKAGITPHMVTPLERVSALVDEAFPRANYPGVIFAGMPFVNHAIPAKFDRHLLLPGSDLAFLWMGVPGKQTFFTGQSTGVLSAALGLQLTTGPVYLVGHDLAFTQTQSHWNAVHADVKINMDGTTDRIRIPGNNGAMVESQNWWVVFQGELADLAQETGRLVNVNGHTGDGARIPHAISAALPDPGTLEPFSLPQWPEPNMQRYDRLAALLRRLPDDVKASLVRLSSSQLAVEDLSFAALCRSENRMILDYICRSIIGQFGMQYRNGQSMKQTCDDCSDALRNVLRQMMPMFVQMSEAPICQEAVPA